MKILPGTLGKDIKVCDCHYDMVKGWKWTVFKNVRSEHYSVVRRVRNHYKQTTILLHRFIMDAPKGMVVDHINGDGLDNRCSNLRVCTQAQNALNNSRPKKGSQSGHKGVYWHQGAQKWCAEVNMDKKKYYLGLFKNKLDAVEAYNKKARQLHGEFFKPA